jgi:RHS repeat-associated protein
MPAMLLAGRTAAAQTCSSAPVTGTITVGDGSQACDDPTTYANNVPRPQVQYSAGGWGTVTFDLDADGDWLFTGVHGDYLNSDPSPGAHCDRNLATGCITCGGGFTIKKYARNGNITGRVLVLPAASPVDGIQIQTIDDGANSPYTGTLPDGTYNFANSNCHPVTNNWGVRVLGNGDGPGTRTYHVSPTGHEDLTQAVSVTSSQASTADFALWKPGAPLVDGRPPDPPAPSPSPSPTPPPKGPCDPGKPVNLVSGNVYFDQSDGAVAGIRTTIDFVRSYNSLNRGNGLSGIFGAGWTHSYERDIRLPDGNDPYVLMLRNDNGMPAYFSDLDHDGTFEATVPYTRESWIVLQPDGSYLRQMRKGGNETYSAAGKLTTIVDAVGNTTVLTYAAGLLTTVTAPGGRSLTLAYNASHQISALAGPAGLIATYTYDGSGRLQQVQYADEAASGYTFAYDAAINALTSVTDLSGRPVEAHAYDGIGRGHTSEIGSGQEKYTLTYNPNQTVVTDALGNVTTYDFANVWGQRLITKVTGPCASCGAGGDTEQWSYDGKGRVLTHVDGNGKTTTYTYEATTGDLLTRTDPLSHTTIYTYDSQGRVLTRTDPSTAVTTYVQSPPGPTSVTETVTSTQTRTTSISYDTPGTVATVTDPRGKATHLAHNATGDLISTTDPLGHTTSFEYDGLGRRTKVTDALLDATTIVHDARGQVTRVIDAAGKSTDYAHDAGGRSVSVTDALGRITQYAYDAFGRLATVTDALGGTTQYSYDAMSDLASITDASGSATLFEYDSFRRLKKVTYPASAFETLAYDAAGRLATRTDRRGIGTTFAYDDVGRLISKNYSDSTPGVTFSYDVVGRLLAAANGTDSLAWTYNLAGEMVSETSAYNSSLVEYLYDLAGNRVSVGLNGAVAVSYAYDDDARLTSMTRGSKVFSFGYDDAHRRTSLGYPDGVATTYAYDSMSRLTTLAASRGTTPITSFGYTYDEVGNRTHKSTLGTAEDYSYDPLYRLTQVVRGSATTETYSYDGVGNRLASASAPVWTYNTQNQLVSQGVTAYTYDANGNLAQKVEPGVTWAYTWNAANQLTSVTRNGIVSPVFLYDPLGRRVKKAATASPTQFTYDGQDILIESRTSTDILMWIHGPGIDEPLASQNQAPGFTDNWKYRHLDGLGSLVTTVKSGAIISTVDYDAFGNGGTVTGYGFTGREFDPETGLLYYRARYYDPKAGRFLSEDPIGFRGGVNFYAYVLNRPTSFVDPSGLDGHTWGPISWYTNQEGMGSTEKSAESAHEAQHRADFWNGNVFTDRCEALEARGFAAEIPILEARIRELEGRKVCSPEEAAELSRLRDDLNRARNFSNPAGTYIHYYCHPNG